MTREIKILCGIPGVGKTTWSKKEISFLQSEGYSVADISRDKIRFNLLDTKGGTYFDHEDEVFQTFVNEINECAKIGIDYIFADATHISPISRMKLLEKLVLDPSTTIRFEIFDFSLETAIKRNDNREGRAKVPVEAIKKMWKKFKAPSAFEFAAIKEKLRIENPMTLTYHNERE